MRGQNGFIGRRGYLSSLFALSFFFLLVCWLGFSERVGEGVYLLISGDGGRLLIPVKEGDVLCLGFINSYSRTYMEDCFVLKGKDLYALDEKVLSKKLPNPLYIRASFLYGTMLRVNGESYRLSEFTQISSRVKLEVVGETVFSNFVGLKVEGGGRGEGFPQ